MYINRAIYSFYMLNLLIYLIKFIIIILLFILQIQYVDSFIFILLFYFIVNFC